MLYDINEIFYSLQGEGAIARYAAVFVRFSGCNLKCSFCDTDHKLVFRYTEQQIVESVNKLGGKCSLVVLTGGEPTLQDLSPLVDLLHKHNKYVAIETNGTNEINADIDWTTVSPKTDLHNLVVKQGDELKVVYTGQDLDQYEVLYDNFQFYWLQPEGRKNEKQVIDCIMKRIALYGQYAGRINWMFSPQLQKIFDIR